MKYNPSLLDEGLPLFLNGVGSIIANSQLVSRGRAKHKNPSRAGQLIRSVGGYSFPFTRGVFMDQDLRQLFDDHLENVLQELPEQVHQLMVEVPLVVDDHPSPQLCRQLGLRRRNELCGLYTGIPLTERNVDLSGVPSDVIQIFREGILSMARDSSGRIGPVELRRQIRVTILHEVGHHFGMSEEDLMELGYD